MSFPLTLSTETAARRQALRARLLDVDAGSFEPLALDVFRYQATTNPVYSRFLDLLTIRPDSVTNLRQIPFMPIGFFKTQQVLSNEGSVDSPADSLLTFASSGTTGEQTSRHYVADPPLYDAVSIRLFEQTYGPLDNVAILALLPSYLERNNSSLVYMVRQFMDRSAHPLSGFFLNDHDELTARLRHLSTRPDKPRVLLIGVTFGLLDWAESGTDFSFLRDNPNLIVMETGGMKGRRKELLRDEVHQILAHRLGVPRIHSEYGMTELLSQAYSTGEGVFSPSPTLQVLLRDINDPFYKYPDGYTRTGGINVIDLANLDSCSFIETQDLGQYVGTDGHFRVIGRFDNSDIRGCNLMIE
ncbi:long-chain-fatty-acid--protein ligase [Spirosoma rhododendri]|uniref:Acyl transferase n=1 Tax=Spirosoma rhododendri TaxID=2728024 RepID=A0A7L5DPT3_9BACT|nr:acyl transferase [Spirosoma rhododendri]QJD77710.1 acyl transferase [Spirosoma rhododendri]